MTKVTFFPVGNADTLRIDLAGGEKILFDYADRRNPDDEDDKRIDLAGELRKDLKAAKRDYYDVTVFTHLDQDHYDGATDFFHLEHDKKYQGNGRIKMNTMWVPASVITEKLEEEESKIIQKEARYRLRNKKGILVFSRPDRLKEWLDKNEIAYDDVKHLIIDAGRTVPGFTQKEQGVEFFVHSPHATRQNETELEVRNDHAIVLLAAFLVSGVETKVQLFADVSYEIIADIVRVTKAHKNEHRLEWDVFDVAHHCSYLSLGPERGKDKTKADEEVAWLFEKQGRREGYVISTSKPIPKKGSEEDASDQPPHRQAAQYYRDVADDKGGEFKVTMEHPRESDPAPLVIEITDQGPMLEKRQVVGSSAVTAVSAPRAG